MRTVVDTNVLIHGRGSTLQESLTVPEVLEEAKSGSAQRSQDVMNLKTEEPGEDALNRVRDLSDRIKSPTSLTDEKIVALAFEKKAKIVSDDKAVQNLAKHLEIPFDGFLNEKIERKVEWELVCPSCGREINGKCPSCGQEPIRRQV